MQESSQQSSSQSSHCNTNTLPLCFIDLQEQAEPELSASNKSHVPPLTNDAQAFTPIRNLNSHVTNCKIGVALTRTWEVNTANVSTWDFIVIDLEGDQIHGKVSKPIYEKFANVLVEGNPVVIENFQVKEKSDPYYFPLPQSCYIEISNRTRITPLAEDVVFPKQQFHFVPFTNLTDRVNKIDYLSDVIGIFDRLSEYSSKKEMTIYNEEGETINITFWDSTSPVNPADFQLMRDKVVVVTTTTVKERNGIIYLTGTKGTKTYLDPDIPAAHKLRQILTQKGLIISRKRVMDISNVQSIDYIQYMISREVVASYTCKATIIQIYHNQGWSYLSCSTCKKKLRSKQSNSQHWCDKCDKYVTRSELKILLHLRVKDNTAEQNLSAFEEVATELIGKTKDELFALDHRGGIHLKIMIAMQVLKALGDHTDVSVSKMFCLCTDSSVIGTDFYIMKFFEGRLFLDPALPIMLPNCKIGVAVKRNWEVNTANASTWEFIVIDFEGHIEAKTSSANQQICADCHAPTLGNTQGFTPIQNLSPRLNSITYRMILKEGCLIILTRNVNPRAGLCNGTQLMCTNFYRNLIVAKIVTGNCKGQTTFIPKITLKPSSDIKLPYSTRKEFPIRLLC